MGERLNYVGLTYPVSDAERKVAGELPYGADMHFPGMLYARLVLSPHAHARVRHIDARRALALAGVKGVYSHANAPATTYCRYRVVPQQPGCVDDESLFASTARFVGDRVAAVIASTPALAHQAAQLVDVDYELLPAALDADAALAEGAMAIHPGGNLLHAFDHQYSGAHADTVATDGVVVQTTVSTQMLHHAALEPHMCLASSDVAGKLTLWSPCQSVYGARTVVADLFGLPYHRVRVIKVPMGGSFGGKQEFILEPVTAFLAMQARKPVLLVLDRAECIRATMVRPMQRSTVSTTHHRDGSLASMTVDTLLAAGGYASSTPDYAEAMAHKLTRLYRLAHYRHQARVAYTNTPVAGGMRGWGAPDIVTCAEIHMDLAARQLGLDPVQLRLRNLVHPGDQDLVGGRSLGDARVRQCLELGVQAFDWQRRAEQSGGTGRLRRGVGLACAAHKNGMLGDTFPETSTMTLKMNEDGTAALNASLHEVGAGTLVTMRTIIGEALHIPPERISACEADTDTTPFDFGCYGSRMTYVCGAGALELALRMRDRLVQATATLRGCPSHTLEVVDGYVRARGTSDSGLSYASIVQQMRMRLAQDMIETHTYQGRSNPGSYAVEFAEVEVDILTGITRVTDFLCVVDIGRAINAGMVEGQCRGAVQAGIGSALCEDVALDRLGRTAPGGFRNYHLVNAVDMPEVRVLLVEHAGDDGPYGAKSVGEIAAVPTAAAIVNAVNRALGTCLTTLPLTPDRIDAALHNYSAVAAHGGPACC
jgi:xanthine dehydrogenase molybdenum-binding subunit